MEYLSKPETSEYKCEHCGAIHSNEFSLTCSDCDRKRESEGLEIEGEK
jgi:recombinational DNA repair protein RecR